MVDCHVVVSMSCVCKAWKRAAASPAVQPVELYIGANHDDILDTVDMLASQYPLVKDLDINLHEEDEPREVFCKFSGFRHLQSVYMLEDYAIEDYSALKCLPKHLKNLDWNTPGDHQGHQFDLRAFKRFSKLQSLGLRIGTPAAAACTVEGNLQLPELSRLTVVGVIGARLLLKDLDFSGIPKTCTLDLAGCLVQCCIEDPRLRTRRDHVHVVNEQGLQVLNGNAYFSVA